MKIKILKRYLILLGLGNKSFVKFLNNSFLLEIVGLSINILIFLLKWKMLYLNLILDEMFLLNKILEFFMVLGLR